MSTNENIFLISLKIDTIVKTTTTCNTNHEITLYLLHLERHFKFVFMMISLWNCRELGRKHLWAEVDVFCKMNHLQAMALTELKTNIEPKENIWKKAGFDNLTFVPSVGKTGGICLMWKSL